MQQLLDFGVSLSDVDINGETPLMTFLNSKEKNEQITRILISDDLSALEAQDYTKILDQALRAEYIDKYMTVAKILNSKH